MTRECYAQINTCMTWADSVVLNPGVVAELEFWRTLQANYNGTSSPKGLQQCEWFSQTLGDVAYRGLRGRELPAVDRMLKAFSPTLASTPCVFVY